MQLENNRYDGLPSCRAISAILINTNSLKRQFSWENRTKLFLFTSSEASSKLLSRVVRMLIPNLQYFRKNLNFALLSDLLSFYLSVLSARRNNCFLNISMSFSMFRKNKLKEKKKLSNKSIVIAKANSRA
jgi:hypothetical protein